MGGWDWDQGQVVIGGCPKEGLLHKEGVLVLVNEHNDSPLWIYLMMWSDTS